MLFIFVSKLCKFMGRIKNENTIKHMKISLVALFLILTRGSEHYLFLKVDYVVCTVTQTILFF